MSDGTHPCLSGPEMYEAAWNMVRSRFFDQSRLNEWDQWKDRFDGKIDSISDAMDRIEEMLFSLNDPYTFMFEKEFEPDGNATQRAPLATSQMLDGNVGYLRIRTFEPEVISGAVKAELGKLRGADAYIIDLRGNLGGCTAYTDDTLSLFLDQGMTHVLLQREPVLGVVELTTEITDTSIEQRVTEGPRKGSYTSAPRLSNETGSKPIVLLIDNKTMSATELFVGALRDHHRAVTVGVRTGGKGIGQSKYNLAYGCVLQITDCRWLPPSREFLGDCGQTVSNGIVPDLVVEQGDSEHDVQLESALNVARETLGAES